MGLSDYIVEGLGLQGIDEATDIQAETIPLVKSGVDIIGLSQTGSGKTYAFGIPALELANRGFNAVQVLVVCPTRELAIQVTDDIRKLSKLTDKIQVAPIVGGANMDRQVQALKRFPKIVVGTPGRLMDHLRRRTLKLDYLKMVVLDEADEMLNMGFKEDIETILKSTPDARQTVMFSATMPPAIQKLTTEFMKDPTTIKSANYECQHALIKQYFVTCEKTQKTAVLEKIIEKMNPWISIVFCNTRKMTEELSQILARRDLPATCLHGDMRQRERSRVMENFKKNGNGGILVATDVAARGIDIKNVDVVVNYDFPNNEDYYVHRIGRTGRAGKPGVSFTIINTRQQLKDLHMLTSKLGNKIEEYQGLGTQLSEKAPKTRNQGSSKPRQGNQKSGQRSFGQQKSNNTQRKDNNPKSKNDGAKRSFDKRDDNKKSFNKEGRKNYTENKSSESKPKGSFKPKQEGSFKKFEKRGPKNTRKDRY